MIWFILINILISILSVYTLAWHCKIKHNLKEVTFDDLLYDYGPVAVFTMIPLMNIIITVMFGGMVLIEKIRHVKIL